MIKLDPDIKKVGDLKELPDSFNSKSKRYPRSYGMYPTDWKDKRGEDADDNIYHIATRKVENPNKTGISRTDLTSKQRWQKL